MELRGGLSTYELTNLEKDTFAEYLQHSMNNPAMEFIKYLLGDDYIRFVDIMSGTTLKIPSSKALLRDLESVKVYLYVKKHNFSENSIREAAKVYKKSALSIRRYILKVSRVLGTEDTLEGDDLNNYIKYIKSVSELDSYYQTRAEAKRDKINEAKKARLAEQENQTSEDDEDIEDDTEEETVEEESVEDEREDTFSEEEITDELNSIDDLSDGYEDNKGKDK